MNTQKVKHTEARMICKALGKIRGRRVAKLIRVGHIRVTHVSSLNDGQKIQITNIT